MKTKTFLIIVICNLLIFNLQSLSNNIQVSNATLTGQVPLSNYTMVQFDLSWENSWRDAVNWDAAWVFVKYKASYDTTWKHATLSASGHVTGSFTNFATLDLKGVFVFRSANGNGNVNITGAQLRWNYGADGVNDGDLVQVKVFAIEMVYIPQGSFYAGDGTLTNIKAQFSQGNTTNPFLITSEAALTLGDTPVTNLGNRNALGMFTADDFNNFTTQTLPAGFPKGYNDFYCMKYEISQGHYTDFLNTLTRHQQKARVESNISTDVIVNIYVLTNRTVTIYRNVITCPGSGNGTTQPINFSCLRPDRACNFLSWTDGSAFMDWAGLRPMTELELEKTCRGPLTPVADEFAWGTNNITAATTISGTENGTEFITNSSANCNFLFFSNFTGGDGGVGPLRCGIFARISTTREQAGSTYYGVMDMSGNINEQSVTVGNATGRLFDGQHGNGQLSVNGNANVTNWPGLVSGEVTSFTGGNLRMGNFYDYNGIARISDRVFAAFGSGRTHICGFRGVRTSDFGTLAPNGNIQK
jgi:formylglycine-generating enzyme required for sulfatase activity